jgi:hypothetical protein
MMKVPILCPVSVAGEYVTQYQYPVLETVRLSPIPEVRVVVEVQLLEALIARPEVEGQELLTFCGMVKVGVSIPALVTLKAEPELHDKVAPVEPMVPQLRGVDGLLQLELVIAFCVGTVGDVGAVCEMSW